MPPALVRPWLVLPPPSSVMPTEEPSAIPTDAPARIARRIAADISPEPLPTSQTTAGRDSLRRALGRGCAVLKLEVAVLKKLQGYPYVAPGCCYRVHMRASVRNG